MKVGEWLRIAYELLPEAEKLEVMQHLHQLVFNRGASLYTTMDCTEAIAKVFARNGKEIRDG